MNKRAGSAPDAKYSFYDESTVIEEIVESKEGESFRIELSEFSMPLKSMHAQMTVRPIDGQTCEVTFSLDYIVKFGPMGWLMGQFMMKPMMRAVTKGVLKGLAYHVVTGKNVGSVLPSSTELAPALA